MNTENNLDTMRDEKCFPVAQAVLKEVATDLFTEETHKELGMKALSLMLAADLNVAMEVAYIPQLILGVLAGLNKTVQECAFLPNDEARYAAIAGKILAIVAVADVRLGKVTPEETTADFAPVKEQLDVLFAEEKLMQMEVRYIMDKVFNSFTELNNLISKSITDSTTRMETKLLGIDSMDDLTLKKLDSELLK